MELLFVSSLFLPLLWRYLLALCGKSTLMHRRDLFVFLLPLLPTAILLCSIAWGMGVYGVFIPLMLTVFWLPQLLIIGLFALCDQEAQR